MGVQELLIVFAILLLFFGAKKLPGLAGSLGTSIKEFRKAAESVDESDDTAEGQPGSRPDTQETSASAGEATPVDRDTER